MKKALPLLCSLTLIAAMVGLSDLLQEPEVIFPEIAALTIGAWMAPAQPWKTTRLRLLLLMMFCSVTGVLLVRFCPVPPYLLFLLGFLLSAVALLLSRTSFVPLLSATMLPILLGTTAWIYPISAILFSALIVLFQPCFEWLHLREPCFETSVSVPIRVSLLLWGKRLLILAPIAALAFATGCRFLIAPPLLVCFIELSAASAEGDFRPVTRLLLLCTVSAVLGALGSGLLYRILGFPLVLSVLAVSLVFLLFVSHCKLFFPPAGAILLLPFLLSPERLLRYPLQITLGFVLFAFAAQRCFRPQGAKHTTTIV